MSQITKEAWDQDEKHMTHVRQEDGARAMVKCAQSTHGMMMGNRYHILIQTPLETSRVSEYTGEEYVASYKYVNLGRGNGVSKRGESWLKENGFEPVSDEA